MPKRPLFIFDLDNTLSPPEVTLWRIVDERIEEYVRRKPGTDPETAHRVRKTFLAEFGTTLRGLMHYHGVSPGDYLEFVHDVPIPELVPPVREAAAGDGSPRRGFPVLRGQPKEPAARDRTGDVHRVGGRERGGVSGGRCRARRVRASGRAPRGPPHVPA